MSVSPCLRTWVFVFAVPFVLQLQAQENKFQGNSHQGKILPTFARDCTVSLPRNGEVRVVLKAVPDQVSGMKYVISRPPAHGTLSAIIPGERGNAEVLYHHDGSKSPTTDGFSFQAQASGRSKSAPATARIEIIPPPAHLSVSPSLINFGSQFLDKRKTKDLVLTNSGGMRVNGRIVLPIGFSAPGGDRFNLDEGESVTLQVEFHPMEDRKYSGEMNTIPPLSGSLPHLNGVGIPRFRAERHGDTDFFLTNLSQQTLKLGIDHGKIWGIPAEIILSGCSKKEIHFTNVELAEEDVSPLRNVVVTDGLTSINVEMPRMRPFIPLEVELIPGENLNGVTLGQSLPLWFRLINRSELAKNVGWRILSRSGGGSEGAKELVIEASASKEILFEWKAALPGDAVVDLTVQDGGKKLLKKTWIIPVYLNKSTSSPMLINQESRPPSSSSDPSAVVESPAPVSIPPLQELDWEVKTSVFGQPSLIISYRRPTEGSELISLHQLHPVFTGLPLNEDRKSNSERIFTAKPGEEFIKFRVDRNGIRESLIIDKAFPGIHELRLSICDDITNIPIASSALQVMIPYELPWWKSWKAWLSVFLMLLGVRWIRTRRNR